MPRPHHLLSPSWQASALLRAVLCAAPLLSGPLAAQVSLSGFGTLGYAISDQEYRYQRFVNEHGTFMRDSVLGVQADIRLSKSSASSPKGRSPPRSATTAVGTRP